MSQNDDILYPPIRPYDMGHLDVGDGHQIYWEVSGNPKGVPIVLFHGGPGAGTSPQQRRFFDPKHYKIILFDQRGSGQSRPLGSLEHNNLQAIIEDIEKLREYLHIQAWHVFGGSWGSTLALCYGIAHPNQCLSFIIRGIFLMRAHEINWFIHGMGKFFPEAREEFLSMLSPKEQKDILNNYYKKLTQAPDEKRLKVGEAWCRYEGSCAYLKPKRQAFTTEAQRQKALAMARIEAHYFLHQQFDNDNYIIDNISRLKHISATAIQGRYDVICPPETAIELAKAWPELDLILVDEGGHSSGDRNICKALIEATNKARHLQ